MRVVSGITLVLLPLAPLAIHAQASDAAFAPDTIVQMPDGPRVTLLHADGGGVAALRLSVPFIESAAEAGAGRMLAALAEQRMAGPAHQIGARVSASRTPWGLAYSVEGADVDLEHLTYLLRLATAEPRPERGVVDAIRAELTVDLERQAESPGDRLLFDLRRAAAPELAVARITSDLLRDGKRRDLAEDMWEITPAGVAGALLALGQPRVFRLGPDLRSR
ncbi:MAG: hypothetical protein VX956_15035 [Gemmatimonadota bacterium]|nr:hypothetical protein [Gemmatimonadota bacterium]